jgi:hypothetical protein
MIRSGLILMIRQKAQAGQSPYAIGKELGISKNTAKKHVIGARFMDTRDGSVESLKKRNIA